MLHFPSYVVSSTGCLIYENVTLGASENSCSHTPCRRLGSHGRPRMQPGAGVFDGSKKLQVRTQHRFRKHQWIFFFFLFLSILLTFATVLKRNSLRFVFLVYHMGTFIKLWQFQFVQLSSQHQIT